jgi:DNA-binding winged helix-turn-helix (wHTH) protein
MPFIINQSHFNFENDLLTINGKKVDCAHKIILAMKLLLQSENQIVSKERLMQELWGDLIVTDDSLFKVIQEIRKIFKANDISDNILINVYGKGYKITPAITPTTKTQTSRSQPQPDSGTKAVAYNPNTSKFILLILLLSVTAIITYLLLNNNKKALINASTYQQLSEMAEIDSPQLLELISKKYHNKQLSVEDEIKIDYLQALAYYKQGNYQNSLAKIDQVIELSSQISPIKATADAYLLCANIHTYTDKSALMLDSIDAAEHIYRQLSDQLGLAWTLMFRGRYHSKIKQLDKSISLFENLATVAKELNDKKIEAHAYKNLAHSYDLLGQDQASKLYLQKTLDLSLEIGYGELISYAYGAFTKESMENGDFSKAMKQAHLTIRYALDQYDTNQFQQSFSSLYNILSILGHDQLAEKYLQQAIDLQNKFNSDGHLHRAELNLGILMLKSNKYQQAQQLFETLLSYRLLPSEHQEAKAWLALTRYLHKDNIAAFTLAKEVYFNEGVRNKNKFIAGISLALADYELERFAESAAIIEAIEQINNPNWLLENSYFIDAALTVFSNNNPQKQQYYLAKKSQHTAHLAEIKHATTPEQSLLESLDQYLSDIFNN